MKIPRRYVRTATVLTIALATGHVMQNAEAIAARFSAAPVPDPVADVAGPSVALMMQAPELAAPGAEAGAAQAILPPVAALPRIGRQAPALQDADSLRMASLELPDEAVPPAPQPTLACEVGLVATPAPGAMVEIGLVAPCAPGSDVRITHAGLAFTLRTDAGGRLVADVPAMERAALIGVTLPDGTVAEARVEVPDLALYDRIAVSWSGAAAIELHAFEFGAGYGDSGHVWRGNPGDTAGGGHLAVYGDADALVPAMAEVYTFPAGLAARDGRIELTLEAEVTAGNCGREVAGHTAVTRGGVPGDAVAVDLAMPDCDAVGDFLVLDALYEDLAVAAIEVAGQ